MALLLSLLEDDSTDGFQRAFEELLSLIVEAMKKLDSLKTCKLKLAFACSGSIVAVNYGCGFEGETDLSGDWRELRRSEVGSPEFLLSTILEPLYLLTGRDFMKYRNCYKVEDCEPSEATLAILASEPLTEDEDRWLELPFGSMLRVDQVDDGVEFELRSLEL